MQLQEEASWDMQSILSAKDGAGNYQHIHVGLYGFYINTSHSALVHVGWFDPCTGIGSD